MSSGYLPLDALACRLALPKTFLKRLAQSGRIPHLEVGGRLRFNESQVSVALAKLAEGQADEPAKGISGGNF